jgi:hypothetical protein
MVVLAFGDWCIPEKFAKYRPNGAGSRSRGVSDPVGPRLYKRRLLTVRTIAGGGRMKNEEREESDVYAPFQSAN